MNNKTGDIISNSKSLSVTNEMVGQTTYDIYAYNQVGRNHVLKELIKQIVVTVKRTYRPVTVDDSIYTDNRHNLLCV